MKNISSFLEKFKKINNRSLIIREVAREILEGSFSIRVERKLIEFKNKTIYLKISGPAKAEMITQKKRIIAGINRRLGEELVSKIR